MEPRWLRGGDGYAGTLIDVIGDRALVRLDEELVLRDAQGWADFGNGGSAAVRRVHAVRGWWLALAAGWEGHTWREPIGRLHVGLCQDRPDLEAVPDGGGVGVWVESHATMHRAD